MPRSLRLAAALALLLLARAASPPAATASAVEWSRPVPGAVTRAFDYDAAQPFVRGRHRGVDLAAPPGTTVRAACAGRVVTARPGQVVTLRCGQWRVTHLPMARVGVQAGQHISAGARIGTLGTGPEHRGLHLGVRRAGDEFGYVDPLAFLPTARPRRLTPPPAGPAGRRLAPPPASPAGRRPVPPPASPARRRFAPPAPDLARRRLAPRPASRAGRRLAPPLVLARRRLVRPPAPERRPVPRPAVRRPGVRVPSPGGLAPWPAWMGLVLVLCGALGGGVRLRLRMRRAPVPAATSDGVA